MISAKVAKRLRKNVLDLWDRRQEVTAVYQEEQPGWSRTAGKKTPYLAEEDL